MHDQEGVIKYQLNHTHKPISDLFPLHEINAWRSILLRLELMGQNKNRYDGYGFGNISQRIFPANDQFIISGTQTANLLMLQRHHFAVVENASPALNQLTSYGNCKPSSEALTHAMIYQQKKHIQAVIHVHCPEIWQHTTLLNIPHTARHIAYGTPDMASAVDQLFIQGELDQLSLFSMLGHEDGVVSFGYNMEQAVTVLIKQLSLAIAIEQCSENR